jgi:hypothetical protein
MEEPEGPVGLGAVTGTEAAEVAAGLGAVTGKEVVAAAGAGSSVRTMVTSPGTSGV